MITLKKGTKPSESMAQKVEPAYGEYLENPGNERMAEAAANALNAHLELVFHYCERENKSRLVFSANLGVFRKLLFGRCPALQMMWDLEGGKRNRFLTRHSGPVRGVSSPGEPSAERGELFVVGYHQPFLFGLTNSTEFWRCWPD